MARSDALSDADAQYLAQIWDDCEGCLGPDAEMLDVRPEAVDEGVRLVARYRLGGHERESACSGDTLFAAHTALRERIVLDRIRFGYTDLVEHR